MRNFSVTEDTELLKYLYLVLKDTKKSNVKQFLKMGAILVNGKAITQFNHPLIPGDKVSVKSARDPRPVPKPDFDIEIVYQDESIVVINKPEGLLSIATPKEEFKTAIFSTGEYLSNLEAEKVRQAGKRSAVFKNKPIYIVHRLDQDASGLMVFARNEAVKKDLQTNWHEAVKKYFAVVEGIPPNKSGTLKSYLHENIALNVYSGGPENGGKLSISHYEVFRQSSHYAILLVTIDTGRKHQIRVQLSDMGHPIAGDSRYGSKKNPARRLALHGGYLSFKHPVTKKLMTFHSPLPKLFDKVLNQDRQRR